MSLVAHWENRLPGLTRHLDNDNSSRDVELQLPCHPCNQPIPARNGDESFSVVLILFHNRYRSFLFPGPITGKTSD